MQNVESDTEIGQKGAFCKGLDKVAERLGIPLGMAFLNPSEIFFIRKERGVHPKAQNLLNHAGSILRIRKRGYINL